MTSVLVAILMWAVGFAAGAYTYGGTEEIVVRPADCPVCDYCIEHNDSEQIPDVYGLPREEVARHWEPPSILAPYCEQAQSGKKYDVLFLGAPVGCYR